MKKKYRFTLHFFRISQDEEENKKIGIILNEYQTFYKSFWLYSFYYKFSPELIHDDLYAVLSPEVQSYLKNKELTPYLNAVKSSKAKDAFFSIISSLTLDAKLNIEMFQYAMKLVNKDDERKKHVEEKKVMKNVKENYKAVNSLTTHCCNFFFYLGIGITLFILAKLYFKETEYDPDFI
jgi:hypothetical protein